MIYSFQPQIDTSDVHVGFFLLCIVAALFIWMMVLCLIEGYEKNDVAEMFWSSLLIAMVIFLLCVTHMVSYCPDHPVNRVTSGRLAGFSNVLTEVHHKHGYEMVSTPFVEYYLPNGSLVSLRANLGSSYPPLVTLYENESDNYCGCGD